MAPNVGIRKSGLCPFLLFLNPGLHSKLPHALSIRDQRGIALYPLVPTLLRGNASLTLCVIKSRLFLLGCLDLLGCVA